jgi:hypothetical protein
MSLSVKEAADLVGMTKTAIFKAIKVGKISAVKDVNGEWQIEPVELFRVYPPISDSSRKPSAPSSQSAIDSLQRENELLRDTVNDLRRRLDAETEARNKEAEERRNLMLLLTDSRTPAQASQTEQPKGFWARLFR